MVTITVPNPPNTMKTAETDLFANADKSALVAADSPDRAFLVARAGDTVSEEFAHLLPEDDAESLHVFQVQAKAGTEPVAALLAEQAASDSTLDKPGTGDDLTAAGVNLRVPDPTPGDADAKKDMPNAPTDPENIPTEQAVSSDSAPDGKSLDGPASDKEVKGPKETK